jgi:hypothetical protein
MTFWITASIVLFLIVLISTFGPMFGVYGDMKHEEKEESR